MPPPTHPPRQVLLFSGHRVDAPGRTPPRFPPALVPRAAAAIGAALDALDADARDLALAQAADGGDLLFAQACVDRGVALRWLLPQAEPVFIAGSVRGAAGPDAWEARYAALRARLAVPPQALPDMPGATPRGADAFERCNTWLLDTALALSPGAAMLHVICLWDGADGDGPGGTAHMAREARRRGLALTWIDLRELALQAARSAP